MKSGLVMALGKKLFTETGKVEGLGGLPVGVPTKVTFASTVKGEATVTGEGKDGGSGIIIRHADGTVDASYEGSLMTGGGQIKWQSHEKSKVVDDEKVEGLEIVTGFSESIIMETEMKLSSGSFINTAYESK
jgi:hypothetical protein